MEETSAPTARVKRGLNSLSIERVERYVRRSIHQVILVPNKTQRQNYVQEAKKKV